MKFENLENKKFGLLTVLKLAPKTKNRSILWVCQCNCGNKIVARNKNILEGVTTDCGCISKNGLKQGQKVARLTLIKAITYGRGKKWECLCECGNDLLVKEYDIKNGVIKSCGCLKEEYSQIGNPVHNLNGTRLQRIYYSMKRRCYLKTHIHYKNYGGRGIVICDEWLGKNGLKNFAEWALKNGYKEDLSIDRIDNNGNYCPGNCKWSTCLEQQNNTSYNKIIEYNGEEMTVSQAARKYNISVPTLFNRINKWNNIKRAIEEPIHNEKRRTKTEGGN